MSEDRQERFAVYVEAMAKVIGHADRADRSGDSAVAGFGEAPVIAAFRR
jgi:hypothetical protein